MKRIFLTRPVIFSNIYLGRIMLSIAQSIVTSSQERRQSDCDTELMYEELILIVDYGIIMSRWKYNIVGSVAANY